MATKTRKIKFEKTQERMTAHSGLLVIGEALKALGITEAFEKKLPMAGSNRGKHPSRYLIPTMISMAGGGRTIEDIQKLFEDPVVEKSFSDFLCWERFHPTTLSKWLRNKGAMISRKLNPIANQQVKQGLQASGVTSFTADIDAMMIESEKKTAEMTYKGFAGYNTMLGFFAETGHCGYQSFRTGNTSPAYGILAALQGMRQNCPKGTDIHRFRSDSAGWSADVLGYCEDTKIEYTVTADMNSAVKRAIAEIKNADWKPLLKDGRPTGREYAETVYAFEKSKSKAHRLIVQRAASCQLDLFSEGRQGFYAISSNSEKPAPEVIFFHNGRGQAENLNKELKYSLNLDYLPTNDFEANRLWFALGVMVYNVFQTLKWTALPATWRQKKVASIRWQLIQIPGRLVYHARQWTLKLAAVSQDIFDILITMRQKLCVT